MRPDEGQMLVDGIDAVADPQGARFALGVLPDLSGLYPRLTAREHIEYFGELQGITGADLRRRIDQLLTLLDMTEIADRRVAGFSHGERTKTALARAIVHNPKNVLLDEPTNGLDVMSTRAVREIIRRLKGEGHTVLFSSHVMQEVSALCDTIVVIARGKIVAAGSPDDLRRQTGHENLEDAFVALSGLEADCPPKRAARRWRRVRHEVQRVMTSKTSNSITQTLVVCRKELKDWSRDRRSIITVLFSSLLAPVIIGVMFTTLANRARQVEDVTVPVVGGQNAPALMDWLRQQAGVTIVEGPSDPEEAVRSRQEDVVVVIVDDFAKDFAASKPAQIRLIGDSSSQNTRPKVQRVRALFQRYSNEIGSLRLIARGISPVVATAVQIEDVEVSSAQQRAATLLGFIPLFIMISAFTGGMPLATDSTAGERERGSIEALLVESRATHGDRRRQVARRHAHGDAERDGDRRAAVRACSSTSRYRTSASASTLGRGN